MTALPLLPPGRLLASDETGHNDEAMIAYGAACAAAEREVRQDVRGRVPFGA